MISLIPAVDYLVGGGRTWAKMRLRMAQIKSWTVSDALWSKVEPLLPVVKREPGRQYVGMPVSAVNSGTYPARHACSPSVAARAHYLLTQ